MGRYGSSFESGPDSLGCLRVVVQGLGAVAAVIGLAARCSADGSGRGNEFSTEAVVISVDGSTVEARVTNVDEVHGEAADRFEVGDTVVVYQGYRDGNCNRHNVGEIFDRQGETIKAEDLRVGGHIAIEGSVRDDVDHCERKVPDVELRNVYETLTEVPA